MKHSFLLFTMLSLTSTHIIAQHVDGIPLADLKEEYISISPNGMSGKKIYVRLNHGQPVRPGEPGQQRIKDDHDRPIEFHSMIHAINFMREFGYDLFQVYSSGTDGNTYPDYILRKEKPKED